MFKKLADWFDQRTGYRAIVHEALEEPIPGGALAWTNWIAGIVAVYATLFGIGKIVFGFTGAGIVMLAIAAAAFYWISRSFRSEAPIARTKTKLA